MFIQGFTPIQNVIPDAIIDIKYATEDNFIGKPVYQHNYAILRDDTLDKLARASQLLRELGYRIVIWDAYRPYEVQTLLWKLVSDERFVAPPSRGSIHNRGCAVDLWIASLSGEVLDMPSPFDDFSERAKAFLAGRTEPVLTYLMHLQNAMTASGFSIYENEWWHFTDVNWESYEII